MSVKWIPEGYTSVTPYLVVEGAAELIEFLKQAFEAEQVSVMESEAGIIGHAEIKINGAMIMLADAQGEYRARQTMLHVYVPDVDAVFERAVKAGATAKSQPENKFYGDRYADIVDKWGNFYGIATHVEDVSPAEIERRFAAGAQ